MTAAQLVNRCRLLGIALAAGPDGALIWEADADPPADLLAELARHKAALLAFLAVPPLEMETGTWICEAIEGDLGLPAGSLTLHPLPGICPGCEFCCPRGNVPPFDNDCLPCDNAHRVTR
jgi:hypothetical protein